MTVTIDPNSLQFALTAILPLVVTFLAGLLRQDRLPAWANEAITLAIIVLAALADALYNRSLGSNLEVDFMVVASYAAIIIRLPVFQSLQGYLQSNWLAFFKAVSPIPMQPQPPTPQPPQPSSNTVKRGG